MNCGELIEKIWELEDKIPDKRTKEYTSWRENINSLYEEYNKLCNFKAFKIDDSKKEEKTHE